MRVEAENLFPQIVVEPAHHADDDDENGDAERHAENGNQRDNRDKRPFGPQITQRQEKFKRQSRHRASLETPGDTVNFRAWTNHFSAFPTGAVGLAGGG